MFFVLAGCSGCSGCQENSDVEVRHRVDMVYVRVHRGGEAVEGGEDAYMRVCACV
jgi:hypothetical protein